MSLNSLKRPFLFFLVLLFGSGSFAKEPDQPSIFVDAEESVTREDQSSDLIGHVKVIRSLEQITCDRAHIDPITNEVTAEGNVILVSPKDYIKAERMTYNFKTKKGVIYNGFIQTGQNTIEGTEILKTGEDQYEAVHAGYTACTDCPASWKITGSRVKADVGSYAYITNPVFKVATVPVLWLPYMVVPIKKERQTGLLPPYFVFGQKFSLQEYGDSFFWAIDKSKDATITAAKYYNMFKPSLEYRFVADQNSRGTFTGTFLNDQRFAQSDQYRVPDPLYPRATPPDADAITRYAIHYDQHFELPDNFVNNINLNLVRDSRYVFDFPNEMKGRGDGGLENRLSLSHNTENSHASVDTEFYEDLIKADPLADNSTSIHRAPQIKYTLLPNHLLNSDLHTRIDFEYLNLSRADKPFDDSSGSPSFREPSKEWLPDGSTYTLTPLSRYRTGQRFTIHPDLSYPVTVGNFDLVPEVAFDETFYQFGYSAKPTTDRRYLRTTFDLKTRFSSVFGGEKEGSDKFKHEIQPEIIHTYVPYFYQDDHLFFGQPQAAFQPHYTSEQPITEFDNLQFDYKDRLQDRHLVTFALTNKFTRKHMTKGEAQYMMFLRNILSQSYDIYSVTAAQPPGTIIQPWSEIRSFTELNLTSFGMTSDIKYYPYQNTATHFHGMRLTDKHGNYVELGYSQSFAFQKNPATGLPTGQVDLSSRGEAGSIRTWFTSKYLDLSGRLDYDITYGYITSRAVVATVKPPGKCWAISLSYEKYLGSDQENYRIVPILIFGEGQQIGLKPPGA